MKHGKNNSLRLENVQNVLDVIFRKGKAARIELSEVTGLTKTAVSSITKELISIGIIEEMSPVPRKGVGRTITPLRIRKDAAYTIGIELSRHKLNAMVINAQGEIVLKKKGPSYGKVGPKKVIDNLFQVIDDIIGSLKRVDAIGIGVPGPLDIKKGIVVAPPKFFKWENIELGKMVFQRYSLPTWIENDANSAALAEKWYGDGKDLKTFLYVLLNEGIGAGIIINGEIYKGPSNYEGEIGHVIVSKGNRLYPLEDVCGTEYILNSIGSSSEKLTDLLKVPDDLLNETGYLIGEALASVANVLGPEKIYIGGEMAILKERILIPIRKTFYKYSLGEKWGKKVQVDLSNMHEDAISVGAATYALRRFILEKVKKNKSKGIFYG